MRQHICKPVVHKNTWYWGRTHTIVIRNGHGLVNVSIENDNLKVATIHGLSVTEDYRGLGTGRTLIWEAEQEAHEMGANRIEICVENGSWVEDWYKRCGYKKSDKCEDWNGSVLVKDIQ